jgi:N-carbamoylputrescine amidase
VGFEQGPEDTGIEFWGNSFLADPGGRVMAQATVDQEEILVAECDPREMDQVRRNWPFFRDRRIDFYGDITKRWMDK